MDFRSFKSKSTLEELKVELRVLENSISEDMSSGDRKIIEKKIVKIQGDIELMDSSVAGDVAMATTNMSLCSEKDGCECGKCQLLKRKDLQEAAKASSPFSGFFTQWVNYPIL